MKRSIILLSGGLDSTVCFAKAVDETEVVLALTFDYGQKAAKREIEASEKICRLFGVPQKIVRLDWLAEITQTSLVDETKEIPRVTAGELADEFKGQERAKAVWVPNRNGIFVNVAAGFAESLDCDLIVAGFNAEEGATFPDNSPEFIRAITESLKLSTWRKPQVMSYTIGLSKSEIVELGRQTEAPLGFLWSCYYGGKEHCYHCESCSRLKRALEESGSWEWFSKERLKLKVKG